MGRPGGLAWGGTLLAPRQKQRRDGRDGPPSASGGGAGGGAAAGAKRGVAGAKRPMAATVQKYTFCPSGRGLSGHGLSAAATSVSDEPTIQRVAEFVMRHGGPVTALVGWTVISKSRTQSRGGTSGGGPCTYMYRTWVSPDGERFTSMRKVSVVSSKKASS